MIGIHVITALCVGYVPWCLVSTFLGLRTVTQLPYERLPCTCSSKALTLTHYAVHTPKPVPLFNFRSSMRVPSSYKNPLTFYGQGHSNEQGWASLTSSLTE